MPCFFPLKMKRLFLIPFNESKNREIISLLLAFASLVLLFLDYLW